MNNAGVLKKINRKRAISNRRDSKLSIRQPKILDNSLLNTNTLNTTLNSAKQI